MNKIFAAIFLLSFVTISEARIWTDCKGRTVEADIVQVNENQTVELKPTTGKNITLPFSAFSPEDSKYLESQLEQSQNLHPVPWETLNTLFGTPLWNDNNLWDDPCAQVAQRTKLNKESSTGFLENYRAYPLGNEKLFREPVYSVALYGTKDQTDSLSLVFINQGDVPETCDKEELKEKIEACGERMLTAIQAVLGEPERDSIGRNDLREKVWRWNWNGHAILLSVQEGKYTAVRIMPIDRADRGGRIDKLYDDTLKTRMAGCVERRESGDVIIHNIPMIDQGPKGYCVPATWERYLRYVNIPADMYLLALAAQTDIGGGTSLSLMIEATGNILHSYGRKMGDCGKKPDIDTVSKYIDRGMPIMWTLMSTPRFQQAANKNTARRKGLEIKQQNSGQNEDNTPGGHICLIIGYNANTREIAISDSWGPRFSERWITVDQAMEVTYGEMHIIKW